MSSRPVVNELFSRSKKLGKGAYGTVKLLDSDDARVTNGMTKLRLPKNKRLVLKQFKDPKSKRNEVVAHLELWKRIQNGRRNTCSRFITQPHRLSHPTISAQNSAIPKGYLGMTLKDFLKKELSQAQSNLKERIVPVLIKEIAQALACLHNHGVIHSDVKLDNFIVYYKPDSLLDVKVKIIDMGIATLHKENKPLIKFIKTNNGTYLNTRKLQQMLEYRSSIMRNDGLGLYANSIILPWRHSFKQFNRRYNKFPDPELRGRTSWARRDLFKHLSNSRALGRRGDGNVRLQNTTYDLYKLEDQQAERIQAATRGMLNRSSIRKIRNEAKPVKKEPSVREVSPKTKSPKTNAALSPKTKSPKTNAARPKTNANSSPKRALGPLSPKRTGRPGGSNIENILLAFGPNGGTQRIPAATFKPGSRLEPKPSATKPSKPGSRLEALLKTHSMGPYRYTKVT